MNLKNAYEKARSEGRLCINCGWIVPKKDWKKNHALCGNCRDALKGVNCKGGYHQPEQEPKDFTGDMT